MNHAANNRTSQLRICEDWPMWLGLVLLASAVMLGNVGCANVGSSADFTRKAAKLDNNGPNTLDIQDDDKRGTATGPGPSTYTSMNASGVQSIGTGSVPRQVMWDGKTFVLSAGTDMTAKGVRVELPDGRLIVVDEFGTSASAPLDALTRGYSELREYWISRDQTERDVLIAQIKAAESIAAPLRDGLLKLLTGLGGGGGAP